MAFNAKLVYHGQTIPSPTGICPSAQGWCEVRVPILGNLKRTSSIWIKERDPRAHDFAWQADYGVFSASASNLESVRDYIARQEEHHHKLSFQFVGGGEFRMFLKKHGETWDQRYVWD